jgi:DNA-binding MarR family transcriptional regulator
VAAVKDDAATALRGSVQAFLRRFGVLGDDTTPCGQPLALSHAQALLVLLERQERAATHQKDLAAALGLDKSSIARLCARMAEAGHIAQDRSPQDGRARVVALTPKGQRVATQLDGASRLRFQRLMAAIPAGERKAVMHALGVLNTAVGALNEKEAT